MKKQRILEAVLFVPVFLLFGGIFVWYFVSAFFKCGKDQVDMGDFK